MSGADSSTPTPIYNDFDLGITTNIDAGAASVVEKPQAAEEVVYDAILNISSLPNMDADGKTASDMFKDIKYKNFQINDSGSTVESVTLQIKAASFGVEASDSGGYVIGEEGGDFGKYLTQLLTPAFANIDVVTDDITDPASGTIVRAKPDSTDPAFDGTSTLAVQPEPAQDDDGEDISAPSGWLTTNYGSISDAVVGYLAAALSGSPEARAPLLAENELYDNLNQGGDNAASDTPLGQQFVEQLLGDLSDWVSSDDGVYLERGFDASTPEDAGHPLFRLFQAIVRKQIVSGSGLGSDEEFVSVPAFDDTDRLVFYVSFDGGYKINYPVGATRSDYDTLLGQVTHNASADTASFEKPISLTSATVDSTADDGSRSLAMKFFQARVLKIQLAMPTPADDGL